MMNASSNTCCYCGHEGHTPASCRSVASLEERKCVIKEGGRCFVCLRRGHISKDCRSGIKCNNCSGRHHVSICHKTDKTRPPNNDKNDTSGNTDSSVSTGHSATRDLNAETPAFRPSQSTSSCYVGGSETVFLQIAKASVFNLDQPDKRLNLHILLDSGSQCSYMTSSACKKLALSSLGRKSISILTFGSKQESN